MPGRSQCEFANGRVDQCDSAAECEQKEEGGVDDQFETTDAFARDSIVGRFSMVVYPDCCGKRLGNLFSIGDDCANLSHRKPILGGGGSRNRNEKSKR